MTEYSYSPLSSKPYTIRLLRILPSNGAANSVRCELFEYTLRMSDIAVHPYEALSYVWGSEENPKAIEVNSKTVLIKNNLYAALVRLRDDQIPRIIWADAICINQEDQKEKEGQIQLMAAIYAKARGVIVWLGETETSGERALDAIRRFGENSILNPKPPQQEIQQLLQRSWFRRIWVRDQSYTYLIRMRF